MMPIFIPKTQMISAKDALVGRDQPIPTSVKHFVLNRPLKGPYPQKDKKILLGMGCFWGAEKLFWSLDGVFVTAVGYAGGFTPNPTYSELCSGQTGHAEVVLIVYDPKLLFLKKLLKIFWESHDPTQDMRQGADVGTNYRSAIYVFDSSDYAIALKSRNQYARNLGSHGVLANIKTEIKTDQLFYYAEEYHQQYLAKNPNGYCGLKSTGISFSE